jgi:hypothetical protein
MKSYTIYCIGLLIIKRNLIESELQALVDEMEKRTQKGDSVEKMLHDEMMKKINELTHLTYQIDILRRV